MNKFIFVLALVLCFGHSFAQDSLNKERNLSFEFDAQGLFNNHEFKRHIAYGYTLGGIRVLPRFSYKVNNDIKFSLGINALRYWGANEYPLYNYVSVPEYNEKNQQRLVHLLPFLRFTWQINEKTSLIMGNIDNQGGHGLDIALWNPELDFSMDNEEGVQLRYFSKYWQNEVWVNWQNFNFINDVDRESFLFGLSGTINTDYSKKHSLFFDYSFMWQHHGGELDTLANLDLDHWINGNMGLNYMILFSNPKLYGLIFSVDWLYCKALKNDTWFFKAGNAVFAKLTAFAKNYTARLGFYYSKDMISFYGSPFFSNIAQRNIGEYYPENKMIYARFDYSLYKKQNSNIAFFTELYHKLDTKTNLTTETQQLSFSLGLKAEVKISK